MLPWKVYAGLHERLERGRELIESIPEAEQDWRLYGKWFKFMRRVLSLKKKAERAGSVQGRVKWTRASSETVLSANPYKRLLNLLEDCKRLTPRPTRASSPQDWNLFLELLKLVELVEAQSKKPKSLAKGSQAAKRRA